MRPILPLLAALLLASPVTLPAADAPAKAGKPNIVFIYADDWGWGDLSCHGNTWLKTPRLDKLASEGIDGYLDGAIDYAIDDEEIEAEEDEYDYNEDED